MVFLKLEEPLSSHFLTCTSIIVRNDKYQESLNLLLEDFDNKRTVYFPSDKDNMFIDTEKEHKGKSIVTFYVDNANKAPIVDGVNPVSYSQLLLESSRLDAYLTITELMENELACFSHNGGGTFSADSTDPLKYKAHRPLDVWLGYSARGYAFAVAIDAVNIEEAIVSLNGAAFSNGKEFLPNVLKVAYFNGERYAITEGQIKEILVNK